MPEQHYQQSGNHVETGHDGHQDKDEQDIEIYQVQPVEYLRIAAYDGRGNQGLIIVPGVLQGDVPHHVRHPAHPGRIPRGRDQFHLQGRDFVLIPSVQPLDVSDVGQDNDIVRPVHHTFIDAGDVEIPYLHVLPYEIGQHPVTLAYSHEVREAGRYRHGQFHGVGRTFLPLHALEKDPVDILAHLDYSRTVHRGRYAPDLLYRL